MTAYVLLSYDRLSMNRRGEPLLVTDARVEFKIYTLNSMIPTSIMSHTL
jgi:hypothetical protein